MSRPVARRYLAGLKGGSNQPWAIKLATGLLAKKVPDNWIWLVNLLLKYTNFL